MKKPKPKPPPEPKLKDVYEHPDVKAFFKHAKENVFPMIESSVVALSICDDHIDAKLCLELGAILLLDKPLILVASKTKPVPARLLRIADAVIDLDDWRTNPEKARQLVSEAILKVVERYPGGKRTL